MGPKKKVIFFVSKIEGEALATFMVISKFWQSPSVKLTGQGMFIF
jgi:hypothetical protein